MSLRPLMAVLGLLLLIGAARAASHPNESGRILVFSKTEGYRHASIEPGVAALRALGAENGFEVEATEDAGVFNEGDLRRYAAVVFLNTTGDVLDEAQQSEFERYVQAGGGYVGIHAASDTEYGWPWYGRLAGAYFESHPDDPNVRRGTFRVRDASHPSTRGLPASFERDDEFYNFRSINPDIHVLVDIDESTYEGGTNGADHPMSWYHEYDGGRAWYTAMGHTTESFSEPLFLEHLRGGIEWAMGTGELDYTRARPEENRFTKVVLSEPLNEPIELAVLTGERVLFIERLGAIKLYTPGDGRVRQIGSLEVSTHYANGNMGEDGLIGLGADPDFARNGWVYMFYSPAGPEAKNVLSRFTMVGDSIDLGSEIVMLEVPVQRDECCHTGGSIAFDAEGNLYLSTGDNTNPFGTGFAPIDERPGRSPWDAQKSSANTNDLRGKILRIRPRPDGSYTIPEGNLFAPGTPGTRPEIYTMGHRNPYRISVDQRTGYLYWGDVGPDAATDSVMRGPRGHDEIGQARGPGNYGWPYFVADNKAYHDYDFATGETGPAFDPARPVNRSPNNTGLEALPPARPALIWYPAGESQAFPLVGTGGRTAMAGPVYHRADFARAPRPFPEYYDGKLFIYEWMRGWIMAVTMDGEGDVVSMERFMPSHRFANPIDMEFAPSGDLYVLEYGTRWFAGSDEARLVRIRFTAGNRAPVAVAAAEPAAGATPLAVSLTSAGTVDHDGDQVTHEWTILGPGGAEIARVSAPHPTFSFDAPGTYTASLVVADPLGASDTARVTIAAGNEPPNIMIDLEGNRSFYFPGTPVRYSIRVTDREDGSLAGGGIGADRVLVTAGPVNEVAAAELSAGHRAPPSAEHAAGWALIEAGTCLSCHRLEESSIGPSFHAVADRYRGDQGALDHLVAKIRGGGAGVWGEVMMPPHTQLTEDEVARMAGFILALGERPAGPALLPPQGTVVPPVPAEGSSPGGMALRAVYTDRGANGVPAITADETVVLRPPTLVLAEADTTSAVQTFETTEVPVEITIASAAGAFVGFRDIDLAGISGVRIVAMAPVAQLNAAGGTIEVRLGSPDGPLLGTTQPIQPTTGAPQPTPLHAAIRPTQGRHDVYFVFRSDSARAGQSLMVALTATFVGEGRP